MRCRELVLVAAAPCRVPAVAMDKAKMGENLKKAGSSARALFSSLESSVQNLESSAMAWASKQQQQQDGSGSSGQRMTIDSLSREEVVAVARRELENSKKLKQELAAAKKETEAAKAALRCCRDWVCFPFMQLFSLCANTCLLPCVLRGLSKRLVGMTFGPGADKEARKRARPEATR